MQVGRVPAQVVVVTGTGGMGMAIARRLGPGRRLVLADLADDVLGRATGSLEAEGHQVTPMATDVSDGAAVAALAAAAADLGPLACVVHTAGVSPAQATPAAIIAVDVLGTAHVLDAFLPHAGPGTVAVCIASMAGAMAQLPPEVEQALATTPAADLAALPALDPDTLDAGMAYAVAKRANQVRVAAASVPWGERGARVVSVSPGVISTAMGRQELEGPSGPLVRQLIERSGTARAGTPDDIAAVVEFLVGPAAAFVTGTDVLVDGGAVAAMRYASPPTGG